MFRLFLLVAFVIIGWGVACCFEGCLLLFAMFCLDLLFTCVVGYFSLVVNLGINWCFGCAVACLLLVVWFGFVVLLALGLPWLGCLRCWVWLGRWSCSCALF